MPLTLFHSLVTLLISGLNMVPDQVYRKEALLHFKVCTFFSLLSFKGPPSLVESPSNGTVPAGVWIGSWRELGKGSGLLLCRLLSFVGPV